MPTPWDKKIKASGKLLIFNEIAVGQWATVFDAALASFNKNLKRYGVEYVPAETKGKANVVMKLMPSTLLHGKTPMGIDPDHNEVKEAEIFLPDNPQVSDPAQGVATASVEVMRVIAVHELIHAAGLSNGDHGGDGVFYSPLSHSSGKLQIAVQGKNQKLMPPIRFDAHVINKIKQIW